MGQKCCSLLTGRPVHEEAPLRPLVQAWHQAPPPACYHGSQAVHPPFQQHAPPPYPRYGASMSESQQWHHAYKPSGHTAGHQPQPTVNCSTYGCARQPWNGKYGEACCRTCAKTVGGEHGPDCNRKFKSLVEPAPPVGYARPATGPAMPQPSDVTCRSCGDTGLDFRGNACACRAGPAHGVQLCDLAAAAVSSVPPFDIGVNAGRLPELGSFNWVLKSNDAEHRQLRLEAAKKTQQACIAGCYKLDGIQVILRYLQQMCAQTRFISTRDLPGLAPNQRTPRYFSHAPGQSAKVALDCTRSGLRTSLVNASSSYHVGGGFLSGGRHALEESLCMQSTLFQSLQVASGFRHDCYKSPYIPDNAVVLSPDVEFFRSGSLDGYRFQKHAECMAAVVSVAMPNANPKVKDAPVDAPVDRAAYLDLLYRKFIAVLAAAAIARSSVVVVPDVGCGVYGNSPVDVGAALGKAIRSHFPYEFAQIHLVGSEAFANAASSS